MFASFFAGLAARLAESFVGQKVKAVVGFLTVIPKPVWEAIAVIGYAAALFALHQQHAHQVVDRAVKAAVAQRDHDWEERVASEHAGALAWKVQAEAESIKIATVEKERHDAQVATNAAVARDLQLRGPGKAAAGAGCGSVHYPGLPAAAGGHDVGASGANAAADQVPSGNGLAGLPGPAGGALRPSGAAQPATGADALAVVPWTWLTDRGHEFDDLLAEVVAWRTWHPKEAAAWQARRARLAVPTKPQVKEQQ